MKALLGLITLIIVFGVSLDYAAGSTALYGSTPADPPQVRAVPCSPGTSGVSHVWNFVDATNTPQVWLHPDPPETEDTWDFWVPTQTPQVWLHPDPPETEDTWDFWVPTGTPQVWLHPDPRPDPDLWDFDVSTNVPHVW
jgi:hypothetical protein